MNRRITLRCAVGVCALLVAPDAFGADDGPLVTDRPDFTESTTAVPVLRMQLEAGYTFTTDDEKGFRTEDHTLPEMLLRIGVGEGVELRLGWEGFSSTELLFSERTDSGRKIRRKEHEDGGTDMEVGVKFHLVEEQGWTPDLGVIVSASLPVGTRTKTSGDVDPQVKWLWAYELTDRASVAGNVNLAVLTSEKGRFFQTAASLTFAYSPADWLGMYVEYYGLYPNDRGTDCAHYLNGGFTFPVNDDLQFDVRCGAGLNEEADDFFVGTGFAIRL